MRESPLNLCHRAGSEFRGAWPGSSTNGTQPVLSEFATPLIPRWSPSFLFIIPDWQHRGSATAPARPRAVRNARGHVVHFCEAFK